MLVIRKSEDRGYAHHGWLETRYTFSFSDYYDPEHRGFRQLRVINQDIVQPEKGFATHSHQDMEIITFVLRGAVAHQDSLGNKTTIKAGEIQRMSAGTGVRHSEFNPSDTEILELLQIWILPQQKGIPSSYEQSIYVEPTNNLVLLISPQAENHSISIHQDIKLWLGNLASQQSLVYKLTSHSYAWIQVVQGELTINKTLLKEGDGAAVSNEKILSFESPADTRFLLFELR